MKLEKLLLVFVTIFCLLFVLVYFYNVRLSNKIVRMEKIIKAYELYTSESKEFANYVKENNLKELEPLLSKYMLNDIRLKIDKAKQFYREGNYSDASALLREIKDTENPWMDEIYFYLGMSLYKLGEIESSKLFLSTFMDNFQYSIYRKEALLLLKELSNDEIKKQIDKVLSSMKGL